MQFELNLKSKQVSEEKGYALALLWSALDLLQYGDHIKIWLLQRIHTSSSGPREELGPSRLGLTSIDHLAAAVVYLLLSELAHKKLQSLPELP
jgi:hypothetical protein